MRRLSEPPGTHGADLCLYRESFTFISLLLQLSAACASQEHLAHIIKLPDFTVS